MSLRPMCFVATPFGRKPAPGHASLVIDFDSVHEGIRAAADAAGLECIRADFEPGGGFIHRPMLERLVVAEYVIADLTFSNANVAYEVGLRHGSSRRPTILICAAPSLGSLPFDLRPLRVLPYDVDSSGLLIGDGKRDLERSLVDRLEALRDGRLPTDNPLMQITSLSPDAPGHEKTDVFFERMTAVSEIGGRIRRAVDPPTGRSLADLLEIERSVLADREVIPQLHSALVSLLLGFRHVKAFDRMVALFDQLPPELQATSIVREQHALALNRMAGARAAEGDTTGAAQLRSEALRALDPVDPVTSETMGIRGRIHKDVYEQHNTRGAALEAQAALGLAIDAYREGFRLDPRDYYPGINALTLLAIRDEEEDGTEMDRITPVVSFAVERQPEPSNDDERYWRSATRLELAVFSRETDQLTARLVDLLGVPAAPWMRATSARNLRMLARAMGGTWGSHVEGVATRLDGAAGQSMRPVTATSGPSKP